MLASFSSIAGGARNIDIPPNGTFVSQNFHVMRQAGRVENFQPHMHLRGKAMSMEAILPNGTTQMLSHVNNFNFNWHNNYVYADDAAPLLPKGTILKITAWHDNTTANKTNPDPDQWVGWGDRTVDEMGHAWVNITYMSDEDFKAEVERASRLSRAPPARRSAGTPHARRAVSQHRCSRARPAGSVLGRSSLAAQGARQLPLEPVKETGQSVTGAFEGWYQNPDGSYRLLVGYFNRNSKQTLDIPVGPNNRIEPGGPDQGQPTHFLPRRQWGVFTIVVPKDFGKNKLTWTLVANGQTTTVPMHLDPLWIVAPFKDVALGNTPPVLRFDRKGRGLHGSAERNRGDLHGDGLEPLTLTVWVTDDGDSCAGGAAARAPGDAWLEQVPRSRRRDIRQRAPPVDEKTGQGDDDRDLSAPGRVHPARAGQRRDRRRRRRLSVLLDERAREGDGQVGLCGT